MTRLLGGVLWAFIAFLSWQAPQAQSTQGQFLPEVDLYWTLNPDLRIQTLQRTFEIDSVKITPYARGEVFYDISFE
jgi:hypothetical protein